MKKKRTLFLLIALLLLVGLTGGYVASTYAKYTSTVEGAGTATVAKWAFSDENAITELEIALDQTNIDASTLVDDRIAPGTSGSFNIVLTNKDTEVGVDFTIQLKSITGQPTNLKFYTDSTYSTELTPGSGTITGQLAAEDEEGVSVPIYWQWPYETNGGDGVDTTDGEAGATLTIGVTITGTQVAPSSTAITSHVD